MLELYHSVNSVCAQKVRVVLAEKGLDYREHLMTLRGDQFSPEYMKLNPAAVVPTLIHDGRPVIESSVILYYLDEVFPQRALMPADPHLRARVRQFNKLIDEYVHNSCTILTFATAFRPWFAGLTGAEIEARLAKSPSKKRTEYKRDVALNGLESKFAREALEHHLTLLKKMDEALADGPWLAGAAFSLADAAVIPYILRLDLLKLEKLLNARIKAWYARMRERPSVRKEMLERMTPQDRAPFDKLEPDPWLKVKTLLEEVA
ncbi:MAG TPA: glutathione S-transferase family protein [Burkholderiales bacterium]